MSGNRPRQTLDRRDVDDRTATGLLHLRHNSFDAEKHPGQVHVENRAPVVERIVLEQAEVHDPGVVHQDIQAPEGLDRQRDSGVPVIGLCDVEMDVAHRVAQFTGECLALVVEDVTGDHARALCDHLAHVRGTHAPRAATHQCNLARQPLAHRLPFQAPFRQTIRPSLRCMAWIS